MIWGAPGPGTIPLLICRGGLAGDREHQGLVRLSIGLEDEADIMADLASSLAPIAQPVLV